MGRLSERETQRVVAAVKQILAQASLTTVAAAKICGVPQQTISRLRVKPPRRLQWRVLAGRAALPPPVQREKFFFCPPGGGGPPTRGGSGSRRAEESQA